MSLSIQEGIWVLANSVREEKNKLASHPEYHIATISSLFFRAIEYELKLNPRGPRSQLIVIALAFGSVL